jgi:hypothetical protein|tara:strand:- start:482 stop:673 length:192 start_codon:yes stop_codon:yes gene_type:complete
MSAAEVRSVVEGFDDRVEQIVSYLEHVEEVLKNAQALDRSLAVAAMEQSVGGLVKRARMLERV